LIGHSLSLLRECSGILTALVEGIAARALVLDDIVESVFGTAVHDQRTALEALGPDFYRALAEEIRRRIEACPGKIPVVTGLNIINP